MHNNCSGFSWFDMYVSFGVVVHYVFDTVEKIKDNGDKKSLCSLVTTRIQCFMFTRLSEAHRESQVIKQMFRVFVNIPKLQNSLLFSSIAAFFCCPNNEGEESSLTFPLHGESLTPVIMLKTKIHILKLSA